MRESRPYGSVRGALSNERSYRDSCTNNLKMRFRSLEVVVGDDQSRGKSFTSARI
jgi:hypothetical protein